MTKNILFIVEGEADEPKLLRQMLDVCFAGFDHKIYTYRTNLHVLAKRLEEDYPEFESDEIDIQLFLKSYENNDSQMELLSKSYTDIFLIFDFDPQDRQPRFDTIRRMVDYFNDSILRGKLIINYPMMQAIRHFSTLPDPLFKDRIVTSEECKKYKEIVGNCSKFTDVSTYTYGTFMSLAVHHIKKANYILSGTYAIPSVTEYENWNYGRIFDAQVKAFTEQKFVYVLNTCILLIVDYKMDTFFKQVTVHAEKYLI